MDAAVLVSQGGGLRPGRLLLFRRAPPAGPRPPARARGRPGRPRRLHRPALAGARAASGRLRCRPSAAPRPRRSSTPGCSRGPAGARPAHRDRGHAERGRRRCCHCVIRSPARPRASAPACASGAVAIGHGMELLRRGAVRPRPRRRRTTHSVSYARDLRLPQARRYEPPHGRAGAGLPAVRRRPRRVRDGRGRGVPRPPAHLPTPSPRAGGSWCGSPGTPRTPTRTTSWPRSPTAPGRCGACGPPCTTRVWPSRVGSVNAHATGTTSAISPRRAL